MASWVQQAGHPASIGCLLHFGFGENRHFIYWLASAVLRPYKGIILIGACFTDTNKPSVQFERSSIGVDIPRFTTMHMALSHILIE